MDALKLFYEQQLDAKRQRTPDCCSPPVATPPAAEVRSVAEHDRRTGAAPEVAAVEDTPEVLLRHLEQHAARPLRTRAAIDAYLAAHSSAPTETAPTRRSLLRETALVLFLVIAALQYYYIDVSLKIAALNRITVFVPVQEQPKQDSGS
jgi:hypothetical protein